MNIDKKIKIGIPEIGTFSAITSTGHVQWIWSCNFLGYNEENMSFHVKLKDTASGWAQGGGGGRGENLNGNILLQALNHKFYQLELHTHFFVFFSASLQNYIKQVFTLLFQRLMSSKTTKFVKGKNVKGNNVYFRSYPFNKFFFFRFWPHLMVQDHMVLDH